MLLLQVRSFRQHPDPRRHVRHGAQHHQRKNLHHPVVLVHYPLHCVVFGDHLEDPHHLSALQEYQVQSDRLLDDESWKAQSLEHAHGDPALRFYGLVVFELFGEKYGRFGFQRFVYWVGGGFGGE